MHWFQCFIGLMIYFSIINLLTFFIYAIDKKAAQHGKQRIAERSLHLLSLSGGWYGAWVAQQKLRHKTQKQPFRRIYFCTILMNLLIILILIYALWKMSF
ncbi:MAG: DUF1294 domain-containing protein [Acinetobacter sp.]